MSINWQWNDKMGTCTYTNGYKSNLYRGNAFVIAVNEWTDESGKELYSLAWFAADEQHMKNMLGLTKGYDECWSSFGICELELNVNYKETAKLVALLAKAKIEVAVKLACPPF